MLRNRLAAYTKKPMWQRRKRTIVGHLAPVAWDDDGVATKFSIYTYDDDDFIIEGHYRLENLKRLINKRVLAIGFIRENSQGEKLIDPILVREHKSSDFMSDGRKETVRPYADWDEEFSVSYP